MVTLEQAITLAEADRVAGHLLRWKTIRTHFEGTQLWGETDQGWFKLYPLDEQYNPLSDM